MPIPRWITPVNRRVTNRVLGPLAVRMPPLAVIHHVGRRSGIPRATPVMAFRTARGVAIALTYGPDVDWLRNVLAAGRARLVQGGRTTALVDPVLLHGATGARLMPWWVRVALRALRVDDYIELAAAWERPARGGRQSG
ncbi:nitroreductase family deazaflavin-dependent oxidoreductase [Cellulomonas timonensis]|uniref:nitroreductase family deazaflavin-dependent oxidoreductase n=1 Tax=Cellulomonas timonensis TaxID=1689271 RepID=UPI000832F384|nr:nitroreductase family deazaflavin-dependent oxidoreductase [Cellulomonas timonensis]